MTLANAVSLSRIPLLFIVIGALMINNPGAATVAMGAFLAAFISDWLDGFLARQMHQVTATGAMLDALVDKIFILGLFIYFLHTRLIPDWGLPLIIIILSREFLITGLRQCALLQGRVIPAGGHGKVKTVVQFLSAFLFVLVFYAQREFGGTPESLAWADLFKFLGRITFGLSGLLALTSGLDYFNRYKYLLSSAPKQA